MLKRVGRYSVNKKLYRVNLTADTSKASVIDATSTPTGLRTRSAVEARAAAHAVALVLSYSRTQTTVATSSAEAELYAAGSGVCEGMLCAAILKELGEEPSERVSSDTTAGIDAQSRRGLEARRGTLSLRAGVASREPPDCEQGGHL